MRERNTKGRGSVYQLPDGRWRGQISVMVDGKRKRPVTPPVATRREAVKLRDQLRDRYAVGGVGTSQRVTVDDWLTYWLDVICEDRVKAQTLDGYRQKVRLYLRPALGYVRLDALTTEQVETVYRDMRRRGLSEATIRQTHAVLRRALKVAEQRHRVTENVAARIELRQLAPNPHPVHTVEETRAILDAAANNRDAARLHVALSCGLRQGEALGLDWDAVHEADAPPWLEVRQALQWPRGRGPVLGEPKTRKARRRVPLTPAAARMLAAWRAESGGQGLVFGNSHGKPDTPSRDARRWREAEARAGVPHKPLHGARGTVVSTLYAQGVGLPVIQELLGHESPQTTQVHYLHLSSEAGEAAMAALGRAQEHNTPPAP